MPLAIISAIVRRSSSVMPGSAAGGCRTIDVPGWPGGPTVIQRIAAVADVVADLEAERVAVEGERGLRVVVREEAGVDGDVHAGHARCGSASRRFSIPDRSGSTCFATHDGSPAVARAASRR